MTIINILQLPVDILVIILKKLMLTDLRNVILTCKSFRSFVINDNTIWRSVCQDRLIVNDSSYNGQNNEQSWYNRCRISNNWCSGFYKCKIIVPFRSNYMPWITLHNSEVLVLSKGSELQCYPIEKKGLPNCKSACWTLYVPTVSRNDVRTNDISRFVIRNNTLVCGNRDGSTSVYKLHNLKEKPQLLHHIQDCHENGEVEVSAVELINTDNNYFYVVTASNHSPYIHFWETNENGLRDIPIHNGKGVKCMAVNHVMDKLAIGLDGNKKPLLLDVDIGKYLNTADGTRNSKQAVRDVGWHNENTVMYVTHSGMLHLIDIRTHDFVFIAKDPFHSTLYSVKSDYNNAIVVGSAEYSRCILFDARNCTQHVQMYFTQKRPSPVYSLDFDSSRLIAASDRGISALNFNINTSTLQARDYSYVFQS